MAISARAGIDRRTRSNATLRMIEAAAMVDLPLATLSSLAPHRVVVLTNHPARFFPLRHGRACPGHPRLAMRQRRAWMPGSSPGMTVRRHIGVDVQTR